VWADEDFVIVHHKTTNPNLEKKGVISVFLSLITSHAISTSRAEHTTSYRGRATTSFISYNQLKTWALLSKDNQSKSWEEVLEN
jgi:hypothetical protein